MKTTIPNLDERWRFLMREAEMARGVEIRREMVLRRGGRRERRSLEGVWK